MKTAKDWTLGSAVYGHEYIGQDTILKNGKVYIEDTCICCHKRHEAPIEEFYGEYTKLHCDDCSKKHSSPVARRKQMLKGYVIERKNYGPIYRYDIIYNGERVGTAELRITIDREATPDMHDRQHHFANVLDGFEEVVND